MGDTNDEDKPFFVDRAKTNRATCKKCKGKCEKNELRIAKLTPSPYGDGKMKNWFHVDCLFEQFSKQRANTQRLLKSEQLGGWEILNQEDKTLIANKVVQFEADYAQSHNLPAKTINFDESSPKKQTEKRDEAGDKISKLALSSIALPFREFRRLVANISNVNSYIEKTATVKQFLDGFNGNKEQVVRMLLPGVCKRIYNLQSKQIVKLFSRIFNTSPRKMFEHLHLGDVAETIAHFYEQSTTKFIPCSKSNLTLQEVEEFLIQLALLTMEVDQIEHFETILTRTTSNDLKIIIRLIKHDLRMNCGAKHVLDAVSDTAYQAFQKSNDLHIVLSGESVSNSVGNIKILTPIKPMLAEACKSIKQVFKKFSAGFYSEIKYDGERVQIHKCKSDFKCYSRNLNPVLEHKIKDIKQHFSSAFPSADDLIIDAEILLIDTNTHSPLPFGTLGVHKKAEFSDAQVCLFVFDCVHYNGVDLTSKALHERKTILEDNMVVIEDRIVLSEAKIINSPHDLAEMITHTLQQGLEGLVLKSMDGIYEPGKRRWLKIKKDYLFDGVCADSADLIVLGAWYGTGKKGGIKSIFLMGVYDPKNDKFKTVTKVHTGFDDQTLANLQTELKMSKFTKLPSWLVATKTMYPDFVVDDPREAPVWEVTGAEFTRQHDVHTADGISIRFPRVTRIRSDKCWQTATNLGELNALFENSKISFDGALFSKELAELEDWKPVSDIFLRKRKSDDDSNGKLPKKVDGSASNNSTAMLRNNLKDNNNADQKNTNLSSSQKRKSEEATSSRSSKKVSVTTTQGVVDSPSDLNDNNKVDQNVDGDDDDTSEPRSLDKVLFFKDTWFKHTNFVDEFDVPPEEDQSKSQIKRVTRPLNIHVPNVSTRKVVLENPLPDIFANIKLLTTFTLDAHLKRHFIAFGGELLTPNDDLSSVTHVLHKVTEVGMQDKRHPRSAVHVRKQWLEDAIKERAVVDFRPYLVKLLSA